MKALVPPTHGLMAAAIDGHESHATYRRCCPGCLKRTIHTTQGDRTQYYPRHVALQLIGCDFHSVGRRTAATRWHADHVYKHDPTALLVFCLVAMICLTVFVVFCTWNLKPQARRNASMLHIARLISADLYRTIPAGPPRTPM